MSRLPGLFFLGQFVLFLDSTVQKFSSKDYNLNISSIKFIVFDQRLFSIMKYVDNASRLHQEKKNRSGISCMLSIAYSSGLKLDTVA